MLEGAMTSWVIGFDLSLTAPAAVALPLDWKPGDWRHVKTWLTRPTPPRQDDLQGQLERYRIITDWALKAIEQATGVKGAPGHRLTECAVESYAFSKNNAQASKLMELGGVVRMALFETMGILPITVSTSSARKLLLGNVPKEAPKIAVQSMLFRAKAPKTWEENICDAMCVCNFALSGAGGVALATAPRPKAKRRKS
jgi:hypothetical protein